MAQCNVPYPYGSRTIGWLCIVYDMRFTKITTIIYYIETIFLFFARRFILNGYDLSLMNIEAIMNLIVITVFCLIVILAERIASDFQNDTMDKLKQDQETSDAMLSDVMEVASEVETAPSVLWDIDRVINSSSTVSDAMRNISNSTLHTAENITDQTTMTQNIQNGIDTTLATSDKMVLVAKKSED